MSHHLTVGANFYQGTAFTPSHFASNMSSMLDLETNFRITLLCHCSIFFWVTHMSMPAPNMPPNCSFHGTPKTPLPCDVAKKCHLILNSCSSCQAYRLEKSNCCLNCELAPSLKTSSCSIQCLYISFALLYALLYVPSFHYVIHLGQLGNK